MSPVRPCLAPSAPTQTARARAPRRAQRAPARRRRRRAAGAGGVAHPRPYNRPCARLPYSPAPSGRQPAPVPAPIPVPVPRCQRLGTPWLSSACARADCANVCALCVRRMVLRRGVGVGVGGQSIAVAEGACRPSLFRMWPSMPRCVGVFPPKLKLAPSETPGGEMRGSECACSRDGWPACDPSERGAREVSHGNVGFRRAAIERSVKCRGSNIASRARGIVSFLWGGANQCEALNRLRLPRRITSHCRRGPADSTIVVGHFG